MEERDQFSNTFQDFLDSREDFAQKRHAADLAKKDYESMRESSPSPISGKDFDHLQKYKERASNTAKEAVNAEEKVKELEAKLLGFIREARGPIIAKLGVQKYTAQEEDGRLKWNVSK